MISILLLKISVTKNISAKIRFFKNKKISKTTYFFTDLFILAIFEYWLLCSLLQ